MLLAVLSAVLLGGVIGALVMRRTIRLRGLVAQVTRGPDAARVAEEPAVHDPLGIPLRMAVDQLALGVVLADESGGVVYRNHAASALVGTHAGVLIEDHVDRVLAHVGRGEHVDERLDLHGPPPMSLLFVASRLSNGHAVVTIADITEQRRIDEVRKDFVANISHELKTPVGAIAVLAEALFGETDPAVVDRVAARMVDESHRAVGSIDDLLELSRIESAPRNDAIVQLGDVVADAIARGRAVDDSKQVTVTAMHGADEVSLHADERQLVSAVGNLVENAIKYSDDGDEVQVRTRCDDRIVEIMVADHGDGIPARDLDRIFERFYRVDRSRRRATGGTGLGLSIVRHVAENHGGQVLVSSTEGEGSTFVLQLPASLVVDASGAGLDRAGEGGWTASRPEEQHT